MSATADIRKARRAMGLVRGRLGDAHIGAIPLNAFLRAERDLADREKDGFLSDVVRSILRTTLGNHAYTELRATTRNCVTADQLGYLTEMAKRGQITPRFLKNDACVVCGHQGPDVGHLDLGGGVRKPVCLMGDCKNIARGQEAQRRIDEGTGNNV
ncbi:MAG: hypothetical protein AAFR64_14080 [Pseudomonadota bacterium]